MTFKQIRTNLVLAAVLVAGLLSAPVASAGPMEPVGVGYTKVTTAPSNTTPSVAPNTDSGFDWGDAAIGAGAAFALTMVGLGGMLAANGRRERHEAVA